LRLWHRKKLERGSSIGGFGLGLPVEDSHRHLAITLGEWEAFMDDVQATLDKSSVPPAEQAEVKALVESTRTAIVVPDVVEPSVMTSSGSLGQDSAAIAS
jgi:hypothetical protein